MAFNHEKSLANHRITRWTFANSTARNAKTGLTSLDIDKVCKEVATSTYWILIGLTVGGAPLWQPLGGTAGAELSENKTDDVLTNATSSTKYPSTKGAFDLVMSYVGTVKYPLNAKSYGNIPLLIASLSLPPGTYTPKATIGAGIPTDTCTMTVKNVTTTLSTLGGTPGDLAVRTGTAFTLTITSTIDFYIVGTTISTLSICKGLQF